MATGLHDLRHRAFRSREEKRFHYSAPATTDVVTNRFQSMSFIAAMKDEHLRQKLVDDVRKIVQEGDGMTWVDKNAGIFEYPYETLVLLPERINIDSTGIRWCVT